MAGPTFPKFRGKFSGIGGQAANVQVPGLPYQKMQRRDAAGNVVKTKVSGDFIDVRVGESRNEYITLNASPLMYHGRAGKWYEDSTHVGFTANFSTEFDIRKAATYRGNFATTSKTATARSSYSLVRLPDGRLATYTVSDEQPDLYRPDAASSFLVTLAALDAPNTPVLSHRCWVGRSGFHTPPLGTSVSDISSVPFRHVMGARIVDDGAPNETVGFVCIDAVSLRDTYVFLGGGQKSVSEFGASRSRTEVVMDDPPAVVRTSPRSLVAVADDTLFLSQDNGSTWMQVGASSILEFQARMNVSRSESSRRIGTGPNPEDNYDTFSRTDATQLLDPGLIVLQESATTALVLMNAGAGGGADATQIVNAQHLQLFGPVDVVGGIDGVDGRHRNISWEVDFRPPTQPELFRLDLTTGALSSVRKLDLPVGGTYTTQPKRYPRNDLTSYSDYDEDGFPESSTLGPTRYATESATWHTIPACTISHTATRSRGFFDYVPAGTTTPVTVAGPWPISHTETNWRFGEQRHPKVLSDLFRLDENPAYPHPALAQIAVPDACGEIRIRPMFGEQTEYLIYMDDSEGFAGLSEPLGYFEPSFGYGWGTGPSNSTTRRFVTSDFVTFVELPRHSWTQRRQGKRRWLTDKVAIVPVQLVSTYYAYIVTDNDRTWTRAGTIDPETYSANATTEGVATTPRFAAVEWEQHPVGKSASPNPYSGAWVCDERVPGPKFEE